MRKNKELSKAATEIGLARIHATMGPPHVPPKDGLFKKGEDPKRSPGRRAGSPNRISRTMKEAVVSAVELLGSTDLDQWEEIVKLAKDDPDPYRRFFTIAAVKDLKTFMAVVGKMVPHRIVHSPAKQYMTVAQAKAELRAVGIPESFLEHVPKLSIYDVDPDEVVGVKSPYDDPELDDEGMRDQKWNSDYLWAMKRIKKLRDAAAEAGLAQIHEMTGKVTMGHHPPPKDSNFKKGEDPKRAPKGRPPGSQNKISRTMKEAVVGAVELLGSTDLDQWEKIIQKAEDDPDPYRRFFTIAAVRDLKVFMAVVGKMVPHHIVHSPAKQYMTVAQAKAELRAVGIPESFLEHVPKLSIYDVDPDEVVGRKSPYDDPELDDEGMRDVTTPKEETK
jgi:hypothetical protein